GLKRQARRPPPPSPLPNGEREFRRVRRSPPPFRQARLRPAKVLGSISGGWMAAASSHRRWLVGSRAKPASTSAVSRARGREAASWHAISKRRNRAKACAGLAPPPPHPHP